MDKVAPFEATRSSGRLLIVSNRLPVVLRKDGETGDWISENGSGGLVSSLMPVLRDRGGVWIGWPGVVDEATSIDAFLQDESEAVGYGLEGVHLSDDEVKGFYEGFSNAIIWPLFHDMPVDCQFDPAHWRAYSEVNRKFAQKIAGVHQPGDLIWVQDYHLMGVAAGLRRQGITSNVGFFLHIPFPAPDLFLKLPWRAELLAALLAYDLVGFQTKRDLRNFRQCLKAIYSVTTHGEGAVQELIVTRRKDVSRGGQAVRRLRAGSFPISIDFAHYAELAQSEAVEVELDKLVRIHGERCMILSIDRLDYTKGLLAKLRAFRIVLEQHPDLRERILLSLHVIPSRENVPEYHQLRIELEQLISEINGAWSRPGWIPVHYYYHSLAPEQLSAYYRRADIMLVSPLKDGMNLVCKEYCASRPREDGVLILSEFAGAAAELQNGALLINPYDVEGTAARIYEAVSLPRAEATRRMRQMRRVIRERDIFHWVNSYLNGIAGRDLAHFPEIRDYVPGPRPTARAVHA